MFLNFTWNLFPSANKSIQTFLTDDVIKFFCRGKHSSITFLTYLLTADVNACLHEFFNLLPQCMQIFPKTLSADLIACLQEFFNLLPQCMQIFPNQFFWPPAGKSGPGAGAHRVYWGRQWGSTESELLRFVHICTSLQTPACTHLHKLANTCLQTFAHICTSLTGQWREHPQAHHGFALAWDYWERDHGAWKWIGWFCTSLQDTCCLLGWQNIDKTESVVLYLDLLCAAGLCWILMYWSEDDSAVFGVVINMF